MKFAISLFILSVAHAAPIHLAYEGDARYAQKLRETLVTEYQVPESLIELMRIGDCEDWDQNGKLDLCLKNNGDLLVVSVDRQFVLESLKVFRAPEEQP